MPLPFEQQIYQVLITEIVFHLNGFRLNVCNYSFFIRFYDFNKFSKVYSFFFKSIFEKFSMNKMTKIVRKIAEKTEMITMIERMG